MVINQISTCQTKEHATDSLIIPTINERKQYLFDLLSCLTKQTQKPNEVIIVCDANITLPIEIIQQYKKLNIKITLIEVSPELTLGATRNVGLRKTKTKYVYFLDDDTLPFPNWLVEMKNSLEKGSDLVGGVSKPLIKFGQNNLLWWDEILMGPYVAVGNKYLKFGYDKIWGCNFAVRRDIVKKIGYFDEELGMRRSFPKMLAEDSEFVDRAVRSGLIVHFNSRAIIHHRLNSDRINFANFKRRAWQEGQTFKRLSKKREGYSTLAFLKVLLFKAFRGFYFILNRKSNVLSLPIHLFLLIYELMGWLNIGNFYNS